MVLDTDGEFRDKSWVGNCETYPFGARSESDNALVAPRGTVAKGNLYRPVQCRRDTDVYALMAGCSAGLNAALRMPFDEYVS